MTVPSGSMPTSSSSIPTASDPIWLQSCLLCGEVWLDTDPDVDFGAGDLHCKRQVTNSLTMFAADNTFLNPYIERCLAIVRDGPHPAPPLSVSIHLLTSLAKTMTFPLVHDLALISSS